MAKTASQYVAAADAHYVGGGIWRVDLVDALNMSVDVEAPETTPPDDVRALVVPAVQARLDRDAE
jgi:hypothetical protein